MVPYIRFRFNDSQQKSLNSARLVELIIGFLKSNQWTTEGRLPPVRVLAHQLNLSKNTVHSAYEELLDRGVIESQKRLGFFIKNLKSSEYNKTIESIIPCPEFIYQKKSLPVVKSGNDKRKISPILLGSVFIDQELLPIKKLVLLKNLWVKTAIFC